MRNVPQSKYDRDYFLHNCDGFTTDGGMCRRLKTLVGHMDNPEITTLSPPYSVIDIGSGRGEVSKHFHDRGCEVLAVDYSYAAMEIFKENNGDTVPFLRHDVSLGMKFIRSEMFDVVILADVVEHLYSEQLIVLGNEVSRIVSTGGIVLIDTPIMDGGESELHVDIKNSAQEVHKYFPNTVLVGTHWHKKPEHCNIILRKT